MAKKKFEIRREEDAGVRLKKINDCFKDLGGEEVAAKKEPQLVSELLIMRSKELLKKQVDAAFRDAQWAIKLTPAYGQALLAYGTACEASNYLAEAVKSLTEALECKGINKPLVKRFLTRVERKVASSGPGEDPASAPAAAAPAPAAAEKPKKEVAGKAAEAKAEVAAAVVAKDKVAKKQKNTSAEKDSKAKSKSPQNGTSASAKKVEKKDKKEKDKEKEKEKPKELEPVQRNVFDFIEWKIESVTKLNHNCVLMRVKSIDMDTTQRDADPGGIWHVSILQELDLGEELKREYTPISNFSTYREGMLEFMIKIYPDGKMTQYLAKLEAGDPLQVSPPVATENLEGCKEIMMVAGGSAVTVAIQICQEALRLNPLDAPVDLYMCNHSVKDILYQDVFDRMLQQYPSFRVVHCISAGDVPAEPNKTSRVVWHGGRLSKEMMIAAPSLCTDQTAPATATTKCLVSGPRGLCTAAANLWKSLGQDSERLHVLDEMAEEESESSAAPETNGTYAPEAVPRTSNTSQSLVLDNADAPAADVETAAVAPAALDQAAVEPPVVAQLPVIGIKPEMPDKQAEGSSMPGFFCSRWRPFWCTGGRSSADADDGEGEDCVKSVV